MEQAGTVFLVGAGPGDPNLITVKGMNCLKSADVILYDRLVNAELLNYSKTGTELIFVGKLPGNHIYRQEQINELMVKKAKQGKNVVRLKGGDPFVFGRGGEEAEQLAKHHIKFEVIPGITAGIAASAYSGIPVTHRGISKSFAIVTGHECLDNKKSIDWGKLANAVDTLAIYMGIGNLPFIRHQLLKNGKQMQTPAAVVCWGTTKHHRTITGTLGNIVEKIEESDVSNPAMIIIGDVVHLREKINWFEQELSENTISHCFQEAQ